MNGQGPFEAKQDILAYYADLTAPIATKQDDKRWQRTLHALEKLRATGGAPPDAPPAQ